MKKHRKSKKGFRSEHWVALTAIFVSLATLTVYIYQARLMQRQQHASVWPFVECMPSFYQGVGLQYIAENKGVGPALIKKVTYTFAGKQTESLDSLFQMVDSTFTAFGYSSLAGRVVAPGEQVYHIMIDDFDEAARIREILLGNDFQIDICYCSVFDDCWISNGRTAVEGTCP